MENVHVREWNSVTSMQLTAKCATTMKTSWNAKFVGFHDKNMISLREKKNSLVYFVQYTIKLTPNSARY
jgi:hypothetical protein